MSNELSYSDRPKNLAELNAFFKRVGIKERVKLDADTGCIKFVGGKAAEWVEPITRFLAECIGDLTCSRWNEIRDHHSRGGF